MELNGQLHALATLAPEKEPPVPIEYKTEGVWNVVCISWIREKSLTLVRNQTKIPQAPSLFPSHYTVYAFLAPLCEICCDLSIFFVILWLKWWCMNCAVKNVILYMDNWDCTVILLRKYMWFNSRERCFDRDSWGFKVWQNRLYVVEDSSHLGLGKCFLMFQRL